MQFSRAAESERTRPAFHSLFGIPRICSSFFRFRTPVAVIASRLLAERANKRCTCNWAPARVCGATFGLGSPETDAERSGWPSCWRGRRLNSRGQDCLTQGSALTQQTCSRPNSFALATSVTGTVLELFSTAEWAVFMTVSKGGRGWKSSSLQSTMSPAVHLSRRREERACKGRTTLLPLSHPHPPVLH